MAAKNQIQREQHAEQIKLGYARLNADKSHASLSSSLQAQQLALAWEKFLADTPAGQIRSIEKAWGRRLTPDELANRLGIDSMPPVLKLQLQSLARQQEKIGQEIAKGMENGSLQAGSPAAKDLQTQYASTQMAMDKLLSGMRPPVAGLQDPAGLGIAPTAAKANTASTAGITPAPAAGLPSLPEKSSTAALGTAAGGLPVLPAQAKEAARIQQIAQAMGLSQGDAVLNAITYGKARQLYALSNDYTQANDIFRAVAGSGDAAAIARARARVQSIKTQAQALLPPNTTSNQTTPSSQVVLDLLGM